DQQIVFFFQTQNTQIAHGHAVHAHVSRHPHAFEYARRECGGTDRSCDLEHRSVRLGTTAEVIPLHHASKTTPFADAHDVHEAFAIKNVNQHAIAGLYRAI